MSTLTSWTPKSLFVAYVSLEVCCNVHTHKMDTEESVACLSLEVCCNVHTHKLDNV